MWRMAKELSADAIVAGTGRTWEEWLAFFDSVGGESLDHKELVAAASKIGAPPWWRQMVSVKYEQHIGRRAPGQVGVGNFNVSASKTWSGSLDSALNRWSEVMAGRREVSGLSITRGPQISATEKWRYWRAGLSDESRVVVNISAKGADKSVISVQHEKLRSEDEVNHWREYWKSVLKGV